MRAGDVFFAERTRLCEHLLNSILGCDDFLGYRLPTVRL